MIQEQCLCCYCRLNSQTGRFVDRKIVVFKPCVGAQVAQLCIAQAGPGPVITVPSSQGRQSLTSPYTPQFFAFTAEPGKIFLRCPLSLSLPGS